ncbi:MAG: OmpA family protein [Candidatus Kapaibacterium sp.]
MRQVLILIVIILSSLSPALAQDLGEIREVHIDTHESDTLIYSRKSGQWWGGVTGGGTYSMFFGNLYLPENKGLIGTEYENIIKHSSGTGKGYYLGLVGEWTPLGSKWGAGMHIRIIDFRDASTETDPLLGDTLNRAYLTDQYYQYISFSPYARYNFDNSGFYFSGGMDFEFNLEREIEHTKDLFSGSPIYQQGSIPIEDMNTRIGINLGIGYEFYIASINRSFRVKFNPYATLHAGTSILSQFNSSWNTAFLRTGLSIKFGPDKVDIDTLKYDPTQPVAPAFAVSVINERGVNFPGFKTEALPSVSLSFVEFPQIEEEIMEEPVILATTTEQEQEPIIVGQNRAFTFPTSSATDLSNEAAQYLDGLSSFLKRNPGLSVRIVGHSDNRGTLQQNTQRSIERANQVVDFLISKGIPRGRLFARGVGSIDPIADNNTAEGRRKNRRVEIQVVQ